METRSCPPAASGLAESAPYPDVSGALPNEHDASLLAFDYAGRVSECTAVMGYQFRSYMSQPLSADVAQAFRRISMTEMHHMELLAHALTALGARPVYAAGCDKCRRSWSGCMVDYTVGIEEALARSIAEENAAIEQYRAHIQRLSQPCVAALLSRIILDEQLHVHTLQQLLAQVRGD